jgi:DNA-directed RNA polymerase II subunit RPB1
MSGTIFVHPSRLANLGPSNDHAHANTHTHAHAHEAYDPAAANYSDARYHDTANDQAHAHAAYDPADFRVNYNHVNDYNSFAGGGGGAFAGARKKREQASQLHDALVVKESRVSRIEFGLFGATEIERMSCQEIEDAVLYDKAMPRDGGLNSRALGTVDSRIRCTTCGHRVDKCPGHYGHLTLPIAVYHYGYLDTVLKLLRCVCFFCSRVLVSDEDALAFAARSHVDKRFRFTDAVSTLKFGAACPHCLRPQPGYGKDGARIGCAFTGASLEKLTSPEDRALAMRRFEADDAREILRQIRTRDAVVLGFDVKQSAPHNMILSTLLVPPPSMRPSIRASTGSSSRGQDDLTHKLQEIVNSRNAYVAAVEAQKKAAVTPAVGPKPTATALATLSSEVEKAAQKLQLACAMYISNNVKGGEAKTTQRPGAVAKDLEDRLKGKEGRLRGNLTGKRVNRGGRTVVGPGPGLDIDEVAVPYELALRVESSEVVTHLNLADLTKRVHTGPGSLDGASRVICTVDASQPRRREKIIDLARCQNRAQIRLLPGWVVERPMCQGERIIFNRQPSLHKVSVMSHRAVITPPSGKARPTRTLGAPLAVTSAYNADFDGDEMNILNPNSLESKAELREILSVRKQMLSAQDNKPCFGLVQDSLLFVFLLTRRNTFLTSDKMMQILMHVRYDHSGASIGDWGADTGASAGAINGRALRGTINLPEPAILLPRRLWTGKQLFSMLLPGRDINLERFTQGAVAGDDCKIPMALCERWVCVRDSELLCGAITKDMMGRTNGGLVHQITLDYGMSVAADFLSDMQRATIAFGEYHGFSIGISDCIPRADAHTKVKQMTQRVCGKIGMIYKQARDVGVSEKSIEASVVRVMSKVLDHSARIVNNGLDISTNAVLATVRSGSKGSTINFSQMLGCVGQQSVDGKRVQPTLGGRTLPCYSRADKSPETRGFIKESYSDGLSPQSFFFHAMAGREGLIDTAVKTATTGYIQRRLMKAMESTCVRYDFSVRSTSGVIEFVYGGDNMDASWLETVHMEWLKWSDARLWSEFGPTGAHDAEFDAVARQQVESMLAIRDEIRRVRVDCLTPELSTKFYLPVHARRLVAQNARHTAKARAAGGDETVLTAEYIQSTLDTIISMLPSAHMLGLQDQHMSDCASLALRASLFEALSVRKLLLPSSGSASSTDQIFVLSSSQLDTTMAEIFARVERARINPGEMVGSLAAESVGEPCTQLTLSAFHFTGVLTKNVSLGVPRVKELISCSKNMKTPSLTLRLIKSLASDRRLAEEFARSLERVYLGNVVERVEISLATPGVDGGSTLLSTAARLRESIEIEQRAGGSASALSAWCLVLVLNVRQLVLHNLTANNVADAIAEFGRDRLFATASLVRDEPCVVVRVCNLVGAIVSSNRLESASLVTSQPESLLKVEKAVMQRLQGVLCASVHVCGVPGIKAVSVRENRTSCLNVATGAVESAREWTIDTEGTALETVFAMPQIDAVWTFSNDIHEVNELLGIEAASALLFHELMRVLSFDGTYVNDRHVMIVVRTIARHGYLMPITRHGINRLDTGALMRSSFEETVDVLYSAAAFAEIDKIRGVTEAILVGKRANMGTGICDIVSPEEERDDCDSRDNDYTSAGGYEDSARMGGEEEVVFSRAMWSPKIYEERFDTYGSGDGGGSSDGIVPMEFDTRIPTTSQGFTARTTHDAKNQVSTITGHGATTGSYVPSSPKRIFSDEAAMRDFFLEEDTVPVVVPAKPLEITAEALDRIWKTLGIKRD